MSTTMPMPAEFAPQDWLWIGFPHRADLWEEFTAPAQQQIAAYANAVAETGQEVRLVVHDGANEAARSSSSAVQSGSNATPMATSGCATPGRSCCSTRRAAAAPGASVSTAGAANTTTWRATRRSANRSPRAAGLEVEFADWVLEGGAIDSDGTGLVVTTEQCLLNPNRNPGLSREEIEARLARDLGFTRVLWLGEGLACDHTDGHVDNLARFVAPEHARNPLADRPGRSQRRRL